MEFPVLLRRQVEVSGLITVRSRPHRDASDLKPTNTTAARRGRSNNSLEHVCTHGYVYREAQWKLPTD